MCIIAIPKLPIINKKRWDDHLSNMIENNPDGNGVIYELNNGEIYWDKDISREGIHRITVMPNLYSLYVHCRVASHGAVNCDMVHPFLISPVRDMYLSSGRLRKGEALVMQNGIFSTLLDDNIKSDTAIMCEAIKKYSGSVDSAEKLISLLMTIAPNSKFIVASTEDKVWRTTNFNKYEYGHFSNTTHIRPKAKITVGYIINDRRCLG